MARTVLLYVLPALLVATHWARLEEGGGQARLPLAGGARARAGARAAALGPGCSRCSSLRPSRSASPLDLSVFDALPFRDADFFGPLGSRLWNGFSAFFEVALPFRPVDQPRMHGAILLAVFAFCVVLALAIATRRPLLASAALIAGAGWPATILNGDADLARGAVVLAAALLLFAGMRSLPTLDVRLPAAGRAARSWSPRSCCPRRRRWPAASSSTAGATWDVAGAAALAGGRVRLERELRRDQVPETRRRPS